jgi:tRNA dimethylallyltransferase
MMKPIVILGPTAVGKSSLAMELAERIDGEIVSVDSLQAYRGLDIGTAKPSDSDRKRVPHHLIDIYDPATRLNAATYATLARQSIRSIEDRGRHAILVGGSGLYLRAILEGLSPIPPVDDQTHTTVRHLLETEGLESVRKRLEELDPETASRLEPGDTQRTVRALQVRMSTGRGLADWQQEAPAENERIEARMFGLTCPRSVLYDRIERRVRSMIQEGWLLEVQRLLDRGLEPNIPAFQAIGYRQLAAHIQGDLSLEQATEDIVRATRQFAKRQMTWFRGVANVCWLSKEDAPGRLLEVLGLLEQAHLGGKNG